MTTWTTTIPGPFGTLTAVASQSGICALLWPNADFAKHRLPPDPIEQPDHPLLVRLASQLDEYCAGTRQTFDLPLDLIGTEFQQLAWTALRDIPYGETRSYGEQATAIGRPTAVRAVGAANGRNPISIVVPCHRVVGATGRLTGFAAGVDVKRRLLEHEARYR